MRGSAHCAVASVWPVSETPSRCMLALMAPRGLTHGLRTAYARPVSRTCVSSSGPGASLGNPSDADCLDVTRYGVVPDPGEMVKLRELVAKLEGDKAKLEAAEKALRGEVERSLKAAKDAQVALSCNPLQSLPLVEGICRHIGTGDRGHG